MGLAQRVLGIDERPFQDILQYAFGTGTGLLPAFGVPHAPPHDLVMAFALMPVTSCEVRSAVSAFDHAGERILSCHPSCLLPSTSLLGVLRLSRSF